jgi:hypothetical protein
VKEGPEVRALVDDEEEEEEEEEGRFVWRNSRDVEVRTMVIVAVESVVDGVDVNGMLVFNTCNGCESNVNTFLATAAAAAAVFFLSLFFVPTSL